ncbi:MAG TPA: hypothetical protein VES36_07450 [Candidatus Limnocylindrales bacterium]|nr:hypothetical protein [Candidatus Limnocylindrales bacterium]
MTNALIDQGARDTVAAVARLLRHAAVCAWAQAEAEGPGSYLHLLGLGIHTASCEAVAMLPAETDLEGHHPGQDDVAQLLVAARELIRSIPVLDQPDGISPLVAAICDLVDEVTP